MRADDLCNMLIADTADGSLEAGDDGSYAFKEVTDEPGLKISTKPLVVSNSPETGNMLASRVRRRGPPSRRSAARMIWGTRVVLEPVDLPVARECA